MPRPLSLCVEDVDTGSFLRCVALVGRAPGLTLTAGGGVGWRGSDPVACEIWVSADDRLILYRPAGAAAGPVVLRREGRSLELPEGKPVVALDQDLVEVVGPAEGRRLRLHVHGDAPLVHPPETLAPEPSERSGRLLRAAAAALAIGAAVGASGCKGVEVRDRPPAPPAVTPDARAPKPDLARPDASVKPIEVRDRPPEPPVRPDDDKKK